MPSWKKVITSGSDASLSNLVVTGGITGSLQGTASYALNGGVTQLLAGPNITLSPTTGQGQVTISATLSGSAIFNTATGSYGSFYDTTTQTNVASTARSMSFNTTDITNGVSISGSTNPFNTYIKTTNAGVYDIQFSAQVDKTDSGTDEIWIWLRKNGSNLADTATSLQLVGNGAHYVAAWNWFVNSAANDYYQIMWYSPDANVRLHAESGFGVVPGIPSVIVTANRVDQFLSNTGSFSGSFNGVFTGSLFGTASWAQNAVTASYSETASYVNPLQQTVLVTGSLIISSSNNTNDFRVGTNKLFVSASGNVGIGTTTPTRLLQVENSQSILFFDPTSTGGDLRITGSTGVPRMSIAIPASASRPLTGFQLGMRTWGDTSFTGYGKVGDSFFYAGNETNGFNILNPSGTGTEDYIRFYAGQLATDTADIHIQGSGSTRGNVGIGKETPNTKLDVNGNTTITGSLNVTAGITGSLQGTVTSPNRTAFRVYGPGGAISATTQMSGSNLTLDYQQGSAFDISTGLFTAPIAGLYQITLVCRTNANNNAGINQVIIYKTSGVTQTTEIMLEWGINTSANHIGGASIARLAVGDTLKFVVAAGTISFDSNDNWSVAYIG